MIESVKYFNTLTHRKAIELYRNGMSKTDISKTLGLQYKTITSWLEGKDKHHEAHKASKQKKKKICKPKRYQNKANKQKKKKICKPRPRQNKGVKLKYHNIKQKLLRDYSSGKYTISALARKYEINRRTAMNWKIDKYGNESIRKKRMYQMKLAEIPLKIIAEFYDTSRMAVSKNISEYTKNMQDKP